MTDTTIVIGIAILVMFAVIINNQRRIMGDLSKLNAATTKLSTDVDALIASSDQTAIDAATAAVDAIDAKVVAATPAATTPAA